MKIFKRKRNGSGLILTAAAVAASCAAFLVLCHILRKTRGAVAEIFHEARLVRKIDLMREPESVFSISELPNVVFRVAGDGSIAFERSDCPDQICVQAGKLSRRGQIAACLPNDVYIRIVPPSDAAGGGMDIAPDEETGALNDAGFSYDI